MPLPTVPHERTKCPTCGGVKHRAIAREISGTMVIYYHSCPCTDPERKKATFRSYEEFSAAQTPRVKPPRRMSRITPQ